MTAPAAPRRWLFGPATDLLLGCGLLYALLVLPFAVAAPALRSHQPQWLVPLLIVLVSMPHYGGTLLRVYEQREDRRAYVLFSLWATLLVAGLFVASFQSALLASLLFTLYITWSPWHYTGQNYGIAVMFLRRRGVALAPAAKRWLHASFVLSFALTFLVFHGVLAAVTYSPDAVAGGGIAFLPLGIPPALTNALFAVVGTAYLVSLGAAATLLLRVAPARDLLPSALIALTQALWFTLPFAVRLGGVHTGIEPFDAGVAIQDYILFVALGHAVQYLWVTTYYARGTRGWHGTARYLGKAAASGVAVWTLPAILFAPDWLGNAEYGGGLALRVAAAVNIHHFILDGAIWKLRNHRIANVLIRSLPEGAEAAPAVARPWLRRGVWAVAAATLVLTLGAFWTSLAVERAVHREDADLAQVSAQLDRLAWVGRDSSAARVQLARAFVKRGDADGALREYERAAVLSDDVAAWKLTGLLHARSDHYAQAGAAFERAFALEPGEALHAERAARAWLQAGEPRRAGEVAARGLAGHADRAELHEALGDAASASGDPATAAKEWREALRIDPAQAAAANNLAWLLATSDDADLRDPDEAIRVAQRLIGDAGDPDPNVVDTLAAGYAAAGRFEEAARTAERAARLARARGAAPMSDEIERRAALYRAGRPYVAATASGSSS
jgi:tetratricopeptide (TPR) repeat protein